MAVEEIITTFFSGNVLGAVGAAIAIAIAGVSSARGLEIAGNTAAGATGEKEENFSSALILQALPQTQVIYAFIIGILIILGIMGGAMTIEKGFLSLMAGVAVGITGISAVSQGKVASSSIGATAKNANVKGKVLIFVVMPEIAALFGFVTAIMLLITGQVF
ncbi:MAG: V-type ATP synthase subunit K [Candidatus Aenigmatarchaeota archaeon]|nr:MAG: V-type ATP synthase subunit K [Candidatus Aenigmarchaeota archaeon]